MVLCPKKTTHFPFAIIVQKRERVPVCLYRRKRRRSTFAFIVEKGEGVRLPLSQKKERCCVAFYAKKRSRHVMSWLFFPKRRIPKKASETTRSRNEKVKSFSTQTFIVL